MHIFKKMLPLFITILICITALPIIKLIGNQTTKDHDIQRVAHLAIIDEAMEKYLIENASLPVPENPVQIMFGDTLASYHGVISDKTFRRLGIKSIKDPESNQPYSYYLNASGAEYEVLAFLDTRTYANNDGVYKKNVISRGSSSGNFITINSGELAGEFLHSHTRPNQKIDLLDPSKREQLGVFIAGSCKEILEKKPASESGIHLIQINEEVLPAYCDMKTDGGGWTLLYANHGHPDAPEPAYSYVHYRDEVGFSDLQPVHRYDDKYLHGLSDYTYFTRKGASELLLTNNSAPNEKWIKTTFSSPKALYWALGPEVLGRTEEGCTKLPNGSTWSIINNDGKISHYQLTHIMNHKGTSWGVSHDKFWCNGFVSGQEAHIAFYVSTGEEPASRTRGVQGLVGKWGGENQFRYFIR